MDSGAPAGAGGQLVGSAGWREGETGGAHAGAAHDLSTGALDSAARCPQVLGQPAPARATNSYRVRAQVAHTAHSPRDYRIEDFAVLRTVIGRPWWEALTFHEMPRAGSRTSRRR